MGQDRNQPCPCGSGKKYKVCCAVKRTSSHWVAVGSAIAFGVVALWALAGVFREAGDVELPAPVDQVWSEEHGHYHDAPQPGSARPSGPAPAGKVWSEEHGHWHDGTELHGLPPGPAPPGKVWNVDHGHWHDEDGGEPPAPETAP